MRSEHFVVPLLITAATLIGLLAMRELFLRLLRRRAVLSPQANEALLRLFRAPSVFWCLALMLLVADQVFPLPEKAAGQFHTLIQVLLILSITVVVANITVLIARDWLHRASSPMATSGIIFGILRVLVFLIGGLILLTKLGISIAPLITALGVGGLAVGLALKDTLENLFSGVHILIDGQIRVNDKIKLETGQEGVIEDIGWRTSKLRMGDRDTLIVPNVKLAQSIITRQRDHSAS